MSSGPKRIGGDWVEHVDKNTGKTYYANLATKETSWTKPDLSKPSSDGDEGTWVERQDPKSGKTFYFNPKTRTTRWDKPASMITSASDVSKDQDQWGERVDPKSGKTYYFNRVTRETTWKRPAAMDKKGSSQKMTVTSNAEASTPTGAPPMPINRNEATAQIKLNADGDETTAGKFAKLRAMAADKGFEPVSPEGSEHKGRETALSDAAIGTKDDDEDDALNIGKLTEELNVGVPFYSMEEYVQNNFNLKRKGMFSKQTTVTKILSWKDELIKRSLHTMSDKSLESEAVQCFKNIASFMGDRSSSKDDVGHAHKLLKNTVNSPEELRDEVFCQLVKQTRNNPSPENTVRGWQLLAICAGTYPPSKTLEKYLLSYCDENTRETLHDGTRVHPGVRPYAKYALMRLKKSVALGPRRDVPTAMEVQAAKERQPVVIRVHLLDGQYKTVPAESWTSVKELTAMVAKKLKILDPLPFATYEVSSYDEERALEDEDRVLDLLSYWQREFGSTKKGKKAPTFQFIFKMRLFFDIPDNDTAAVDLAYIQAVHDVTDSRYPCNQEDCLTLAALQAQEKFGDYSGGAPFEEGLGAFLPAKYLKGSGGKDLEDSILKIYAKLKGYSSQEAKLNYLDYVKSWKIYGSAYFFVEPQNSRDFPSDVVLAINAKGVLVVDPETKDFLAEYPYSEIVTWGHSQQTFVLVVGNLIRQTKIYFKTDQGVDMNSLVHSYVNKLLDRAE